MAGLKCGRSWSGTTDAFSIVPKLNGAQDIPSHQSCTVVGGTENVGAMEDFDNGFVRL